MTIRNTPRHFLPIHTVSQKKMRYPCSSESILNETTHCTFKRVKAVSQRSFQLLHFLPTALENQKRFFRSSNKYGYIGQLKNGLPHGKGIFTFKDGSIHEGLFEQGLPHGYGKLTLKDKTEYDGYFDRGDLRRGKIRYTNGLSYRGSLKNKLPHGLGILTKGNITLYKGKFWEGKQKPPEYFDPRLGATDFARNTPEKKPFIIYAI